MEVISRTALCVVDSSHGERRVRQRRAFAFIRDDEANIRDDEAKHWASRGDWKGGHGFTIWQVLPFASGMPTNLFQLTQEKSALDHGNDRGHGSDHGDVSPYCIP